MSGDILQPKDQIVSVFLLYHVSHVGRRESIVHQNSDGALLIDPEAGDDVKLLGCYSSADRADLRIRQARLLDGFRDEPDCFFVDRYIVDRDEWSEGYQVIRYGKEQEIDVEERLE